MDTPLTICESQETIPESLKRVIEHIDSATNGAKRSQLFVGVLYVLMQECGFVLVESTEGLNDPQSDDNAATEIGEKRTMSFNIKRMLSQATLVSPLVASHSGPYKLLFQLVGVQDYRFHLLMVPTAEELMVINLLIKKENFKECYSIALRMDNYVPKPEAKNISSRFSSLRDLSIIFKDGIAHKGRSAVLNEEGVVNNSLIGMLYEVQQRIAVYLPLRDLLNFGVACQALHAIFNDNSLWIQLLLRDFSYKASEKELKKRNRSIKDLYKGKLERKRPKFESVEEEEDMCQYQFDSDDSEYDGTSLISLSQPSFDYRPFYTSEIETSIPDKQICNSSSD